MACWWRRPRPRERRRVSRGSPVGVPRREAAIEDASEQARGPRGQAQLEAARAAKEIEEFSNEFLNAARKCFDLIDVDCSGTLTKAEIVEAVRRTRPWCPSCGRRRAEPPPCSSRSASSARSRSSTRRTTARWTSTNVRPASTSRPIDATPARGVADSGSREPRFTLDVRTGRRRSTAASRPARCPRSARAARAAAAEDEEFSAEF